jgi:hypothetical protein
MASAILSLPLLPTLPATEICSFCTVTFNAKGICGCLAPPCLELIIEMAKARIANHVSCTGEKVDPSLMVIQTELGYLRHAEGNLSFIMGRRKPEIGKYFYKQLKPEIMYEYDGRQSSVWERRLVDGEQFQVSPEWKAAILPFMAHEAKLTVTVFIRRSS